MPSQRDERPPPVPAALLRPYASVVLLRCSDTGDTDPGACFEQLRGFLADARRTSPTRLSVELVASGLDEAVDKSGFDDVEVTVHKVGHRPGWLKDPTYLDVSHELTVAVRKADVVAVHAVGYVRDAVQRWLDTAPRPHLRRVPTAALETALLGGETKSLWLRGTHSRRNTKADGKTIVGPDLRAALSPFDDATFAMSSARSALAADPARTALRGTVGTTPHSSLVWNRQTGSIGEFLRCVSELIAVIEEPGDGAATSEPIFPLLAQRVYDLAGVEGAYEISCLDAADLAATSADGTERGEERTEAARLLQAAHLDTRGRAGTPDFDLEVTVDGAPVVRFAGRPRSEDGRIELRFDLLGEPAVPAKGAVFENALGFSDLLTVYYASGHAINGSSLFRPRIKPVPFPNWSFQDLAGYDLKREKPRLADPTPGRIHRAIGGKGDRSLFAWCVRHFGDGWLTCDDGSGEVADFVHLARDGTLSLVHVKGAGSGARARRISATAYEVVVSQAVKNIMFLESDRLLERLRFPPVPEPACWRDGERIAGRAEIVREIAGRDARDAARIVVVQPHVSKHVYDQLYANQRRGDPPSADMLRLHRVENMLNSSRPSVTGVGADLDVVAALR